MGMTGVHKLRQQGVNTFATRALIGSEVEELMVCASYVLYFFVLHVSIQVDLSTYTKKLECQCCVFGVRILAPLEKN